MIKNRFLLEGDKVAKGQRYDWLVPGLLLVVLVLGSLGASAQTTVSTGSVQGTITDQTGAVVPGANITIANQATGQTIRLTSSGTGTYSSGALIPGNYTIRVEASGFRTVELSVNVAVGVTTSGNVTLQVGAATEVVEVTGAAVAVNTEQATVQGVLKTEQIEQMPLGGRNFLDLAQLSPGVQIQDAGNFMPTKEGFASISFTGRWGQAARIEVDGIDISDETFGTTLQNIPANSILEFQLSQSSLDLSTELTSSGAVNVVTKSGSNDFHGEAFSLFRFHDTAARIASEDRFWRRQQYGARLGGPLVKDKLFFSGGWEYTNQDLFLPVELTPPFTALSGGYNLPFDEHLLLGRLDWQVQPDWRIFYRFSYDKNALITAVPDTYQPFGNQTFTRSHAVGVDFLTGTFTHSVRFGYIRSRVDTTDQATGASIVNPAPEVSIAIGFGPFCGPGGGNLFCSGPSFITPQYEAQRNLQVKYDGSKVYGSHILRYGVAYNRIRSEVNAALVGSAPSVLGLFIPPFIAMADLGPFPGGSSNPLNYPVTVVVMSNRIGCFTEIPRFGSPCGGVFDDRFAFYIGDTWKARRNLTISYGLRYVRDTGRSSSDLPPIPILEEFGAGLGARVNQPNTDFAPQVGVAWDPWKDGKTVIRAGAGIYYENTLHSAFVFDRPSRIESGAFLAFAAYCPFPFLRFPNGQIIDVSSICFAPIGTVAAQMADLQSQFHDASLQAQVNGLYIGNLLAAGNPSSSTNLISPDYKTAYSLQFNAGFERELGHGMVVSVDYLRNVGLRWLLAYDTNHLGDARFLNSTAALNAINATNAMFGCPAGSAGIDCAIGNGASIIDYAQNGLDSAVTLFGGQPSINFGIPADFGAAFPGINPNVGQNQMLFPIGRSVYDGLQVVLRQNLQDPFRRAKNLNLQVSYALSRFESLAVNQDFRPTAIDFANIHDFSGPNALDRRHQLSAGGVFDFEKGFRVSFVTHLKSRLPLTLTLPQAGLPGEIFRTDVTGDGTTGDVLPGTNVGSFGREVSVGDLNSVIQAYNGSVAGSLTPAGQALVDAGLFTTAQLLALGAVAPSISPAPAGQVGVDSLLTFDLKLSWVFRPVRQWESFSIEPSMSVYNLFNFANYDGAAQFMSGILSGAPGSANGTTADLRSNRITFGSGTFAFGAPRLFEWGLKISF